MIPAFTWILPIVIYIVDRNIVIKIFNKIFGYVRYLFAILYIDLF